MITTALKSYSYIIVALGSILGSIIAAPYISNFAGLASPDTSPLIPSASAVSLPFTVDHHVKIKEKVGDAVKLEEWNNDADRNCEMSCTYVRYQPGSLGKAGLAYVADSPVDLSGAKRVHFFLMGEKGGEMVKVRIAGKSLTNGLMADSPFKEKFAKSSNVITLPNDWKRYEISVDGIDLKGIVAPFAIELLKGKTSTAQGVYFKFIVYEKEPVDQRFVLAANTTDNSTTALTADNSTTASNKNAIQGNNNTRGQVNEDIEGNNGNNRTTADTQRINNGNDGSDIASSAPINSATADTSEEQIRSSTGDAPPVEPRDDKNSPPVAIPAVESLVAHPNDNVILDGSLSSDPDGDKIIYHWGQSSGPTVQIIDADSATPTITVPNLNKDDTVTIDLVVSDGQSESKKASVVINIQYVEEIEGSNEQNLRPDDAIEATGWSDVECGSNSRTARNTGSLIVNCLTDNSDSTFIFSESPGKSNLLFSIQDFADAGSIDTNSTSNSIAYVTAQVTAKKTANSSFISFLLDNPNEQEHYITPSLSILSDSFEDYSFSWKYDPVTGGPWSVDSLNSLVAGYRYLAGQGSIEISEFRLIVTTIIGQEEQQEEEPSGSSSTVDEEERSTTVEEPAANDEDSAIDEGAPAGDNVPDASAVESDESQGDDESEQDESPNGISITNDNKTTDE